MGSLFGWTVAVFAVIWTVLAIRGISRQSKRGERFDWLVWVGGFLVVLGAVGFFGAALTSVGMVKLPASFEWPPGYVSGVVTSPNGFRIVPLQPLGRVQVYGPDWRYLRGWQVGGEGGPFKIVTSQPEKIEVYTLRGSHHFTYIEDGQLLATEPYTQPYDSLPNSGRSQVVPTFPLLWPFSSPFLSIGLVVIGAMGPKLSKWLRNRPTM
jgi:hypothetical protein